MTKPEYTRIEVEELVYSLLLLVFVVGMACSEDGREEIRANLVLVEGGTFKMGDAFGDGGENERPAHEVTVSDFYISRHEVTVAQFKLFVGETEYRTSGESLHYCWRQAGRTRRKMGWRCL